MLNVIHSTFYSNTVDGYGWGGAIYNEYGSLSVIDSSFISNQAGGGGAILNEGVAILNSGQARISSTTFTGNNATTDGGNTGGGAIFNHGGTLTLASSMLSNNLTNGRGGAVFNYGAALITNTNTTFYSNSSQYTGGAIFYNGGGLPVIVNGSTFLLNNSGSGGAIHSETFLTLTNSTLISNTAQDGGAIYNQGILSSTNNTFASNSANRGGGIYGGAFSTGLRNTIMTTSPSGGNCFGILPQNNGNNIDDGSTCGWGSTNGSMSNINPMLSSLQNNGGSTQTMALLPGSPAFNAVKFNAPNGCPATDQRGVFRPQAGLCDIGAYEVVTRTLKFFPLIFR